MDSTVFALDSFGSLRSSGLAICSSLPRSSQGTKRSFHGLLFLPTDVCIAWARCGYQKREIRSAYLRLLTSLRPVTHEREIF